MIRAEFMTPKGVRLDGYIIGLQHVYCIHIFSNGESFGFNKNLMDLCLLELEKFNANSGLNLDIPDFSPLRYRTTIDAKGFKNINGEFYISKKITNAGRLSHF